MLTLNNEAFRELAGQMFGRRRCDGAWMRWVRGPAYTALQGELERLAGEAKTDPGAFHPLEDSFDRVNRAYFEGRMARPRLTWSARLTGRKFGHYDFTTDEVQISSTLDSPGVPEFVVDSVMHHELLHKVHGLRWERGRCRAHTPAFRRDERSFARYTEADDFLRRLSRTCGAGV